MPKTKTSITSETRKDMPSRGRSKKTLILEMLREESLLDLKPKSTDEDAEKAFFKHIAKSAFDHEDSNRGVCLNLLANKGWANLKPSNELIEFDFDVNAKPHIQASQAMNAAANGVIPPDLARVFVDGIASMLKIQEVTDFEERLAAIEKIQNEQD